MATNKLSFKRLHAAISGRVNVDIQFSQEAGEQPLAGGKSKDLPPIVRHQNANILVNDPAFLGTLTSEIFPALFEKKPQGNQVLLPRYLDEFTDGVTNNNPIAIRKALTSMFSERSIFKQVEGKSVIAKIHYFESPPVGLEGEDDITLNYAYQMNFEIPARKIISMSPQTRAILGFDSVNFFDENGFVEDSAVFTTADKAEIKQLEAAEKSTVGSYTGVDIVTSVSIGKIITNINDIKTISYSTHRDVVHGRSCGSAYASGLSRGGRTIAGSIICSVRLKDPMTGLDPQKLLGYDDLVVENDKDLYREQMLPDQYPLFDMLILYSNEYGDTSALNIYGIAISDSGQTSSISDTETEIQYTYIALDLDPIKKLKFNAEGSIVNPYTNEYGKRKKRIIEGNTLHNDPFNTPSIVTSMGNLSHLDFVL